jgi:hypothetical protein
MSHGTLLRVKRGGMDAEVVEADKIYESTVTRDDFVDISVDRLGDREFALDLGVCVLNRAVFLASWDGRDGLISLSRGSERKDVKRTDAHRKRHGRPDATKVRRCSSPAATYVIQRP